MKVPVCCIIAVSQPYSYTYAIGNTFSVHNECHVLSSLLSLLALPALLIHRHSYINKWGFCESLDHPNTTVIPYVVYTHSVETLSTSSPCLTWSGYRHNLLSFSLSIHLCTCKCISGHLVLPLHHPMSVQVCRCHPACATIKVSGKTILSFVIHSLYIHGQLVCTCVLETLHWQSNYTFCGANDSCKIYMNHNSNRQTWLIQNTQPAFTWRFVLCVDSIQAIVQAI